MDIIQALKQRKSYRAYKPDPVPREILQQILDAAIRTPSTLNSQPWEIAVITGEALQSIKAENLLKLDSGISIHPETPYKPFEGVYRQRQVELAIDLFKIMGITREDKARRSEWLARGFYLFGAPAAIILSMDKVLKGSDMNLLDFGAMMQSICLAAMNFGLGTCINDQFISYPEVVRKYTGIPEWKQLIVCIAVGYPDLDFPANKHESRREPVGKVTTWLL
jgi:nitroreductase